MVIKKTKVDYEEKQINQNGHSFFFIKVYIKYNGEHDQVIKSNIIPWKT